jgi:putative membrane protein
MTSKSLEASSWKFLGLQSADLSIAVLSVLYLVGIVGILLPIHPDFILLTPLNLLVSVGLVLWCHGEWQRKTVLYLLIAYLAGFGAELFGVQTGLLFGDYAYGHVLGLKIWGTPLMIGVNWLMLGYCAGILSNTLLGQRSFWLRGTLAALMMVGLDVMIEPVAMAYGFWSWEGDVVPLQNYLGWLAVAWPLEVLFAYWHPGRRNKVAVALFCLQIIFFAALLIF